MRLALVVALFAVMSTVIGCATPTRDEPTSSSSASIAPNDIEGDVGEDGPVIAASDNAPSAAPALDGISEVRASAHVNLRDAAGAVIAVIPEGTLLTLLAPDATNGFYNVSLNGVNGYSSATHLEAIPPAPGLVAEPGEDVDVNGPASPANAMARAGAAMGFSYYWGGGAWLESGPTTSNRGSCSGSCPSCTHSGTYGADCSGLVSKAWQLGPKNLATNSHPYSTADFVNDVSGKWSTISRGAMKAGDALVYNTDGHGHIAIYEKGDGWGSPTVLECRGCAYGCVRNARNFGAAFHGIRRAGF